MFRDCDIFSLRVGGLNTSNVVDMHGMFRACAACGGPEEPAGLESWDTSSVVDMSYMFLDFNDFNCDVSDWDVSSARSMVAMFYCCEKFDRDLSAWDISPEVRDSGLSYMFQGASSFRVACIPRQLRGLNNLNEILYGDGDTSDDE